MKSSNAEPLACRVNAEKYDREIHVLDRLYRTQIEQRKAKLDTSKIDRAIFKHNARKTMWATSIAISLLKLHLKPALDSAVHRFSIVHSLRNEDTVPSLELLKHLHGLVPSSVRSRGSVLTPASIYHYWGPDAPKPDAKWWSFFGDGPAVLEAYDKAPVEAYSLFVGATKGDPTDSIVVMVNSSKAVQHGSTRPLRRLLKP